ncbi:MAG: alanine--tRNA ligase, partial [bacterium]
MNSSIRSAHEIRRAYIEFFVERGHTEVPGAPLIPKGDPTLLFTSAGMVQFKDYYLQPDNLPYTRATSVQKCLRAGDLESVGKTLRHHTFFEMLGNFSFGDYFKLEAIRWGWEFVVDLLELPEDKLYVSVYEEDDEAFTIWNKEIGLGKKRIFRLGKDDNFWGPVGKTGVCGPCSEIYFDTGVEKGCGEKSCAPGCDCDRYLEFWNLVFPQFFFDEAGEYIPLEKPGIDTGLGLERLATIMQGVPDNFHTDLFSPIVERLAEMIPTGVTIDREGQMGINMVADHARALAFTISEGIYPANEGRGYLVRRLLRRALTKFYSLGITEPFLHTLVDVVADIMRADYPELEERRRDTAMIIRAEEESFFRTLEDGKARFGAIAHDVKELGGTAIDGEKVFMLYDTYGLPVELTRELASGQGLGIDEDGFTRAMEDQRRRAQQGSAFTVDEQEIVSMIDLSSGESSSFIGYESVSGVAEVRRYRLLDKSERGDIAWLRSEGAALELILDRTPFYATSGGQVADIGWIDLAGKRFKVMDVFKRGGDVVHLIESDEPADRLRKAIERERRVHVQVDDERRLAIARNHTATHLLHASLREVVGRHVTQAGSLVDAEHLRFDFNHFQALSKEAKKKIEEQVNRWIREAIPVRTEWMDYQKAVEQGAMALFDEKYGTQVRIVRVGDISLELCGGTHIGNTGQIGLMVILSESSVAAGVRRIEAATGAGALAYVQGIVDQIDELGSIMSVSRAEVTARFRALQEELERTRRELRRAERGEVGGELDKIIDAAVTVAGVRVACGRIPVTDLGALRNQADVFRNRVPSGVAVLSAPVKGKLQFV